MLDAIVTIAIDAQHALSSQVAKSVCGAAAGFFIVCGFVLAYLFDVIRSLDVATLALLAAVAAAVVHFFLAEFNRRKAEREAEEARRRINPPAVQNPLPAPPVGLHPALPPQALTHDGRVVGLHNDVVHVFAPGAVLVNWVRENFDAARGLWRIWHPATGRVLAVRQLANEGFRLFGYQQPRNVIVVDPNNVPAGYGIDFFLDPVPGQPRNHVYIREAIRGFYVRAHGPPRAATLQGGAHPDTGEMMVFQ